MSLESRLRLLRAATLLCAAPLAAAEFRGEVIHIADGDTLTVLHDRQQVRIRLHGIDAPEKAQPFGTAARQYAGGMAFRHIVTVRIRDYDRYGRTVAEIILLDGRSQNEEMGWPAWW